MRHSLRSWADDTWLSQEAPIWPDAKLTVFGACRREEVPRSERWVKPLEGWVPSFVSDVHLGALTRRLRLLGFDCVYERDADDARLASIAYEADRALSTRDRGLLKRKAVERGYLTSTSSIDADRADSPIGKAPMTIGSWS